jgi:hypothetical protein
MSVRLFLRRPTHPRWLPLGLLAAAGAVVLAAMDPRTRAKGRSYTDGKDQLPDRGTPGRMKRYFLPRKPVGKCAVWFLAAFLVLALLMLLGIMLPIHNILVSVLGWVGIILAAVSYARDKERSIVVLLLGTAAAAVVIGYVAVQLLAPA